LGDWLALGVESELEASVDSGAWSGARRRSVLQFFRSRRGGLLPGNAVGEGLDVLFEQGHGRRL
jgi:hypothetical protein